LNQFKTFHFQEIDWLISFPNHGNQGKYATYTVVFKDRNGGLREPARCVKLGELADAREFEQHYPHTVGFYKGSIEDSGEFKAEYLELRIIRTVEDFWMFLNALDI
jgi:hypothetical protein